MPITSTSSADEYIWSEQEFSFVRPPVSEYAENHHRDIKVQLIGNPHYFTQWDQGEKHLFVNWYGTTPEGHSVRIRSGNKLPYMHSLCPPSKTFEELSEPLYLDKLKDLLTEQLQSGTKNSWEVPKIVSIEVEKKTPLWGRFTAPVNMFKFVLDSPKSVPPLRRLIVDNAIRALPTKCYNSDIDFTWRCMIDAGFSMGGWVTIPAGRYSIRPLMREYQDQLRDQQSVDDHERVSGGKKRRQRSEFQEKRARQLLSIVHQDSAQQNSVLDVHCDLDAMKFLDDKNHAPCRVLTTDIECAGRKGVFPEPEVDPVICIGNLVNIKGVAERRASDARLAAIRVTKLNPRDRAEGKKITELERKAAFSEGAYVCFHLKDLNPDKMPTDRVCHAFAFDREADMLLGYASFLRWLRPEFVLSWNGHAFDFPYLIMRSRTLGIEEQFCCSGDVQNPWRMAKSTFTNKAYGERSGYEILYPGITFYDVMRVDQREVKRRSYTLGAVAKEVVGKSKEDLHYSLITPYFDGTLEERTSVFSYCLIDCARTFEVCYALLYLNRYLALSMVSGCSPYVLMAQGVIARSYMMLNRKCCQMDVAVDYKARAAVKSTLSSSSSAVAADFREEEDNLNDPEEEKEDDKFEGAHVFTTIPGRYPLLITLDFASLYPSIIQAYNLCLSTVIDKADVHLYAPEDLNYFENTDTYHVKSNIYEGVIAIIERELVAVRGATKKEMAKAEEEGDHAKEKNLDGLQLAQKLLGNGFYGFCGQTNKMPNKNIGANVTFVGQKLIKLAATLAIEMLSGETPFGTFPNAFIAAGDTDSIMICLDQEDKYTVEQGLKIGRWLAGEITKQYPSPVKLEFEKVYAPAVMVAKKRYAGVWWTKPTGYDKIDSKGMESKRRDNSPWEHDTIVAVQDEVLVGAGVQKAIEIAQKAIAAIYAHTVPLDDLITSAQLSRSTDKYKTIPAQVFANDEIRRREGDGAAFKTGDRVPYIVVPGPPKTNKGAKARYPPYVKEDNQYGDVPYYVEKLGKSLARFIDPLTSPGYTARYILRGPHCRKRVLSSPAGPMAKFLVVSKRSSATSAAADE